MRENKKRRLTNSLNVDTTTELPPDYAHVAVKNPLDQIESGAKVAWAGNAPEKRKERYQEVKKGGICTSCYKAPASEIRRP